MELKKALRILAYSDTVGTIDLLRNIRSKVDRIIEREADIHGDSDVLVMLDNLFDYLNDKIAVEELILESIQEAEED